MHDRQLDGGAMSGVQSGVDALRGVIDGAASLPGEAAYETAVSIWNGVIERRPAVVVSCTSSGDVAAALAFARAEGLEVSVVFRLFAASIAETLVFT